MNWNQLDSARVSRQRWLDEHAAAAERGDASAMSLAKVLAEEYGDFVEGLQRYVPLQNNHDRSIAASLR